MLVKMNVRNNPYVGIFLLATDKFCIAPDTLEEKERRKVEEVLGVDVVTARISGTSLVGVFAAGNSRGVVLPWIVYGEEVDALKEAGIRTLVVKDVVTAWGNLLAANDRGGIISPLVRRENVERIADFLGIRVEQMTVAGVDVVGAAVLATNRAFLVHPNASGEEIRTLRDVLGVEGVATTANFGDPFVGTSVVANSRGTIVGEDTTPVELMKIQDVLG